METKICTKCGETKELDLFRADKRNKDGKQGQCKECRREADRKYRLENPEKGSERSRKWRLENPEKEREIKRKYRLKNPEKGREYARKWYRENPEKGRERSRKWYRENPEKAREYDRKRSRELKPSYVKDRLRKEFNIPNSEITPLDIKEKREQLQYHRQIKSLTKQLKQNENLKDKH